MRFSLDVSIYYVVVDFGSTEGAANSGNYFYLKNENSSAGFFRLTEWDSVSRYVTHQG